MLDQRIGKHKPAFVDHILGSRFVEPIKVQCSGTECYALSSMGTGLKTAHSNFLVFLVWAATVLRNLLEMILHEITELHSEAILPWFFAHKCSDEFED